MFNQTFEDSRDDEKQSLKNQDELSSKNLNYFYDSDTRESFGIDSSTNNEVDDSTQKTKKLEIKNKASNNVSNQITNDEIRKSVLEQIKAQLKHSHKIISDKDFDPSKIQFQKIEPKTENGTDDNSNNGTKENSNEIAKEKSVTNYDFVQRFSNKNLHVNYKEIAKVIPWFTAYSKQPIEVNAMKVRAYLKNFNSLDDLIKMRTKQILNHSVKAESKIIDFDEDLTNYEFLDDLSMSEDEFKVLLDYKIYEMKFYRKYLPIYLDSLKHCLLLIYQFIVCKYFVKLDDESTELITCLKNTNDVDNAIINYLVEQLQEEAKKECQI